MKGSHYVLDIRVCVRDVRQTSASFTLNIGPDSQAQLRRILAFLAKIRDKVFTLNVHGANIRAIVSASKEFFSSENMKRQSLQKLKFSIIARSSDKDFTLCVRCN